MTVEPAAPEPPEQDPGAAVVEPVAGAGAVAVTEPLVAQPAMGAPATAEPELPGTDPTLEPAPSTVGATGIGGDPGAIWRLASVVSVELTLPSSYPEVLLLETPPPHRRLRIPVGLAEGTALAYAWRRITTPRPLTHQLMVDVLDRHNVRVEAVRITAVTDGIFAAELDTTSRMGRQVVPCRSSDALAVALRQKPPVPILVADWVFADQVD